MPGSGIKESVQNRRQLVGGRGWGCWYLLLWTVELLAIGKFATTLRVDSQNPPAEFSMTA